MVAWSEARGGVVGGSRTDRLARGNGELVEFEVGKVPAVVLSRCCISGAGPAVKFLTEQPEQHLRVPQRQEFIKQRSHRGRQWPGPADMRLPGEFQLDVD